MRVSWVREDFWDLFSRKFFLELNLVDFLPQIGLIKSFWLKIGKLSFGRLLFLCNCSKKQAKSNQWWILKLITRLGKKREHESSCRRKYWNNKVKSYFEKLSWIM